MNTALSKVLMAGVWRQIRLRRNQVLIIIVFLLFVSLDTLLNSSSVKWNDIVERKLRGGKFLVDTSTYRPTFPYRNPSDILNNEFVEAATNPWEDGFSGKTKDTRGYLSSINKCNFRQYTNASHVQDGSFAREYINFKSCIMSQDPVARKSMSNSDLIQGSTGKFGDLNVQTAFKYKSNPASCSPLKEDAPKVVYLVKSSDPELRRTVRRTWGSESKLDHKIVFFVQNEAVFEDDVVSVGGDDSAFSEIRFNLAMLNWMNEHCSMARLVAVTSETTYVNKDRVELLAIKEMFASNRLYGSFLFKMEPNRDPDAEHYLTEREWPWSYLPAFTDGDSYVMSSDVVPRMLFAASSVPNLKLTKTYMTGLLPQLMNIIHLNLNNYFNDCENVEGIDNLGSEDFEECSIGKLGFLNHVQTPGRMSEIHDFVEDLKERKVVCTSTKRCLAKVDDKCIVYAPDSKSKTKKP